MTSWDRASGSAPAALKAATLSFNGAKGSTPSPGRNRGNGPAETGLPNRNIPLLAAQMSVAKLHESSRKSNPSSPTKSSPGRFYMAGPHSDDGQGEVLPPSGSVMDAKRRLFQGQNGDTADGQEDRRPTTLAHKSSSNLGRGQSTPEKRQTIDLSSIEDTSSLVSKFEGRGTSRSNGPAILAPTPLRSGHENPSLTAAKLATQLSPPVSRSSSVHSSPVHRGNNGFSGHENIPNLTLPPARRKETDGVPKPSPSPDRRNALIAATTAARSPSRSPVPPKKQLPPQPPPPRGAKQRRTQSIDESRLFSQEGFDDNEDLEFLTSRGGLYNNYNNSPSRSNTSLSRGTNLTSSSRDLANSSAALTAALLSTSSSRQSSPTRSLFPDKSGNRHQISSQLTGGSIAHAIQASSLASTRVPTPIAPAQPFTFTPKKKEKNPPPPPPLRRRRSASDVGTGRGGGLRPTMRKLPKEPNQPTHTITHSSSQAQYKKKHPHLVKSHPHKYSEEGRRWRHKITDKERKRYEGVWAANKGLLYTFDKSPSARILPTVDDPKDLVEGIIARDIFQRSRLSNDHLAEVWDLVDRGKKGKLDREEFVVGMWLIDQCLKGRKVPTKVHADVWGSVKRLGVDVRL